MAYRIASASKRAQKQPSMKPSAAVKTPKKMMFFGNLRRTPEKIQKKSRSQVAVAMYVRNKYLQSYICTPNAMFSIYYINLI